MQKRTFENLILNGEDRFLEGNITISSKFEMKNANLIVSGNLTILCNGDNVEVENGNIIVSGDLIIRKAINIKAVNISCNYLWFRNINISDGDIWVNTDLESGSITSDGNIQVGGNPSISDVTCLNYLVTGNNYSDSINASQDIYILGNNDSCDLTAREIFIDGDCHTNDYSITAQEIFIDDNCDAGSITAHKFECRGNVSCKRLSIG